jgi:hypothetical protein
VGASSVASFFPGNYLLALGSIHGCIYSRGQFLGDCSYVCQDFLFLRFSEE